MGVTSQEASWTCSQNNPTVVPVLQSKGRESQVRASRGACHPRVRVVAAGSPALGRVLGLRLVSPSKSSGRPALCKGRAELEQELLADSVPQCQAVSSSAAPTRRAGGPGGRGFVWPERGLRFPEAASCLGSPGRGTAGVGSLACAPWLQRGQLAVMGRFRRNPCGLSGDRRRGAVQGAAQGSRREVGARVRTVRGPTSDQRHPDRWCLSFPFSAVALSLLSERCARRPNGFVVLQLTQNVGGRSDSEPGAGPAPWGGGHGRCGHACPSPDSAGTYGALLLLVRGRTGCQRPQLPPRGPRPAGSRGHCPGSDGCQGQGVFSVNWEPWC